MGPSTKYARYNTSAQGPRFEDVTQQRIDQFLGGYFAKLNLSSAIELARTDAPEHIKVEYWNPDPEGGLRPGFGALWKEAKDAFDAGNGVPARKGDKFGPTWSNHWFKVDITVPEDFKRAEQVIFEWDSTGEALVYDAAGNGLQGLTGGTRKEDRRVEFILPPSWFQKGSVVLYIEASTNGMTGNNCGIDPPVDDLLYPVSLRVAHASHTGVDVAKLVSHDLVVPNLPGRALYYDFEALTQLAAELPPHSPLANISRHVAADIASTFKPNDPASIAECRKLAQRVLGRSWENELEKARPNHKDVTGHLWALGHCHIDTAWLWPWEVTKRKVARSWSTQLDLIDRYPEYRFIATSAQQYAWLEYYYPDVFKRLQTKVKEGTFQVEGATWLEHDANMLSGESFCRQFLLGQNFFLSRFGKRCNTFVLPDTFGYSPSLPQIARLSGCTYFFTQKISWNKYNKFPLTTFNWVGLDGTQILTHMTPTVNYNSSCEFSDIVKAHTGHHNLAQTPNALLLFGNGDGGGGPTPDHIERLRRWRAVSHENDPKGAQSAVVRMGGSLDEFFEEVLKDTDDGKTLPSWWGELYLEIHRGTYTSQARTKKGNRDGEIAMRNVEMLCTLASLDHGSDFVYPHEEIRLCWEALCLCHFHDTLPGSVIHRVADDLADKYAEFRQLASAVMNKAEGALLRNDEHGDLGVVINPTPFTERLEVVKVDRTSGVTAGQGRGDWQIGQNGQHQYALVHGKAGGTARFVAKHMEPVTVSRLANGAAMSNGTVSITIEDGRLTSLRDVKLDRELISGGRGAGFVLFQDCPLDWDAWDVDEYHLETPTHLAFSSVDVVEEGPLRAVLQCSLTFGSSKGTVFITLDACAASVDKDARSLLKFDTELDWRERHCFLKFELPTTVHALDATYDAAFGVLKRAVHRNTTFEQARFEVSAHKFADVSEYNYGVALINNCKYGYGIQGNILRFSLLRSPMRPDDTCDQGFQEFAFAILPHVGNFESSVVAEVAENFNVPLRVNSIGTKVKPSSLLVDFPFRLEGSRGVSVETIKRGEADIKGGTSVVLRTFEHFGGQANSVLSVVGLNVKKASVVNILEDVLEPLEIVDRRIKLRYKPFEIKTIMLVV